MAYDPRTSLEDMLFSMSDPIIVFPGDWQDTVPKWLRQQIELDRMTQVMEAAKAGKRPDQATDAEALAYLSTVINIYPFPHDWTNIYLWLSRRVLEKSGQGEKAIAIAKELAPKELSVGEQEDLGRFKEWLWTRRLGARKRASGEGTVAVPPPEAVPVPTPAPPTAAPRPPRRKRRKTGRARVASLARSGVDARAVLAVREGDPRSGWPHFEFETSLPGGRMDDDPEDQDDLDVLVRTSFEDVADVERSLDGDAGNWTWRIVSRLPSRGPEDLEAWRDSASERLQGVASSWA